MQLCIPIEVVGLYNILYILIEDLNLNTKKLRNQIFIGYQALKYWKNGLPSIRIIFVHIEEKWKIT